MTKLTLSDIANLSNETSAVAAVNANSASIETAIENTLSRDGTGPNQMEAAIDMNSNRVINLPAPISNAEPLRLVDLSTFNGGGTISTIPAGGTTGQTLVKNTGTSYDVSWTGGPGTVVYTSNKLSALAATTSAELASVISDETGTGLVVFGTAPTLSNPAVGTQTVGDNSTKAASTAFVNSSISAGAVATRTALKAIDTTIKTSAILTESGRTGAFNFLAGNYSAHITADTNEGVYIKANAIASSAGAWVRQFDFENYWSRWFGTVADHSTNNSAIINTIMTVSNLTNTLTGVGQQAASNIHIEGGVRFASTSLSFLPSADWIFVNLFYFANSDTTKGVPDGGGGTNELVKLRVNSGYPGDATGAMVSEENTHAPLHPSHTLNVAKQISGADTHFGTGQVRIPTALSPARASYNIKDENVERFRLLYQSYGNNNESNGILLQPFNKNIDLNNVGSASWPTIPANGTVITGVTSGAKGVKTSHSATDCFVNFRSGQFLPGEKITDGVTTSTNNITSPSGVTYTETSYPSLTLGFDYPVCTYGVPPGYSITGFDIGARLTSRLSTGSLGGGTHKETVTNAAHLFTNTAAATPADGVQIVLDNNKRLVTVDGVANGTGSTGRGFVQGVAAWCNFTNSGGVSTNAGNIASVTRTGAGVYVVLFTNALANANYSVSHARSNIADNLTVTGETTAGFQINSFNAAGTPTDLVGTAKITVTGGI